MGKFLAFASSPWWFVAVGFVIILFAALIWLFVCWCKKMHTIHHINRCILYDDLRVFITETGNAMNRLYPQNQAFLHLIQYTQRNIYQEIERNQKNRWWCDEKLLRKMELFIKIFKTAYPQAQDYQIEDYIHDIHRQVRRTAFKNISAYYDDVHSLHYGAQHFIAKIHTL